MDSRLSPSPSPSSDEFPDPYEAQAEPSSSQWKSFEAVNSPANSNKRRVVPTTVLKGKRLEERNRYPAGSTRGPGQERKEDLVDVELARQLRKGEATLYNAVAYSLSILTVFDFNSDRRPV